MLSESNSQKTSKLFEPPSNGFIVKTPSSALGLNFLTSLQSRAKILFISISKSKITVACFTTVFLVKRCKHVRVFL